MSNQITPFHLRDESVNQLQSVLGKQKDPYAQLHTDNSNDLHTMCRIVAQEAGIEFDQPISMDPGLTTDEAVHHIAESGQFAVRMIELSGKWWQHDNGPILAFLQEQNSPCALIPQVSGGYVLVTLIDGHTVKQKITEELAQGMVDKGYSFYRPLPEGQLKIRDIFFHAMTGMWRDMTRLLLTALVLGLIGLAVPIVMGAMFDNVIPNASMHLLWQFIGGLVAITIGGAFFKIAQIIASIRLQLKINASLQPAVLERLLRLPAPFFRKYTAGDLAMRAGGIDAIQQMITGSVLSTVLSGIFSIFTLGLMFYYDVRLAFYALGLALLVTIINIVATYVQLKYQRALLHLQGKLSGVILQLLTNISKIRSTNSEPRAFSVWAKDFTKSSKLFVQADKIVIGLSTFNAMLTIVSTMILYILVMSRGENLSFGSFIAFNAAFGQFFGSFLAMTSVIASIIEIIPTYERVKPILKAEPEMMRKGISPGRLTGKVELSRVSFRYQQDMPLLFRDLSMTIEPGEFVAIVGPSGAGKSTIFRLLLGFEKPEVGSILYDNRDLTTLDIESVRRQMGVVLQHGALLPGTIMENVVGAGAHLKEKDAWRAIQLVALSNEIEAMPMGLHTMLTEGGTTLSVGQRQRLMIARAIIREPRILFFDEATSALDNRTQALVNRNLEQLNVSRVVAAHRLSTIRHADRIYVIQDGIVVEQGTYDSLMAQRGLFNELAIRQQDNVGDNEDGIESFDAE